jgi:hypothetical protein
MAVMLLAALFVSASSASAWWIFGKPAADEPAKDEAAQVEKSGEKAGCDAAHKAKCGTMSAEDKAKCKEKCKADKKAKCEMTKAEKKAECETTKAEKKAKKAKKSADKAVEQVVPAETAPAGEAAPQ